jgi:hypothetical protein
MLLPVRQENQIARSKGDAFGVDAEKGSPRDDDASLHLFSQQRKTLDVQRAFRFG